MFYVGAQIQIADRITEAARDPHAAAALRRRRERTDASIEAAEQSGELVVRMLADGDMAAAERLAELDSAALPARPLLGAISDGELIAALSLGDGAAIADPFHASKGAVDVLRGRAAQLADETGRRRRFRVPKLPRARGAIAGSPPGGGSNLLQL